MPPHCLKFLFLQHFHSRMFKCLPNKHIKQGLHINIKVKKLPILHLSLNTFPVWIRIEVHKRNKLVRDIISLCLSFLLRWLIGLLVHQVVSLGVNVQAAFYRLRCGGLLVFILLGLPLPLPQAAATALLEFVLPVDFLLAICGDNHCCEGVAANDAFVVHDVCVLV